MSEMTNITTEASDSPVSNKTVLRLDDVRKSFGNTQVLRGISFDIHQHEVVALLGPSGSGPTALQPVRFTEDVPITTAQQMYEAVTSRFDEMDVLVMAAAVADYRPAAVADDKIKKKDGDLSIAVERTPDILGTIGPKKKGQFLCGFSMETRDMLANSSAKLEKKNLDMVVANNLKVAGAGFGVDTNVVTFITPDGARELPLMSKDDVADAILDEILKRRK